MKYRARRRSPRAPTTKPFTPRPSASRTVPIAERRRNRGDEFAERRRRQRPELQLDRTSRARRRRAACRASAAWCRAHRACSPARSSVASSSRPPSACNSPLSAMPERCAPTTAMVISSPPASVGNAASGGCARPLRAHRQFGVGMEHAADAGELRVVSRRRQQRDAERNAVGAHRGRQRQAAEVEQVDEIGVGAEPAVELDRIGQHLRGRVGGRRRRQHHRVEVRQRRARRCAAAPAADRARRRYRPRSAARRRGDLARHRMDRIRRGRQQVADHQIALGDPRSFVEQPRGLVERFEIELDQRGAERGPALERLAIGLLRRACRRRRSAGRCAARRAGAGRETRRAAPSGRSRENGSAASGPAMAASAVIGVVDGEREHRDAIQRAAGRHHAGGRDQPEARLQPDDVVEHRRHAAGARGIGAERQRHQPGGDRDRRSRTRSARNQIAADRIDAECRRASARRRGRWRTGRDWSCR